jgi:hypothetical protein
MKGSTIILIIGIVLSVCGLIYGIYLSITHNPQEPQEATQKTLEYIGFDGKKHQAIVVHTAQRNWVLVEKR